MNLLCDQSTYNQVREPSGHCDGEPVTVDFGVENALQQPWPFARTAADAVAVEATTSGGEGVPNKPGPRSNRIATDTVTGAATKETVAMAHHCVSRTCQREKDAPLDTFLEEALLARLARGANADLGVELDDIMSKLRVSGMPVTRARRRTRLALVLGLSVVWQIEAPSEATPPPAWAKLANSMVSDLTQQVIVLHSLLHES